MLVILCSGCIVAAVYYFILRDQRLFAPPAKVKSAAYRQSAYRPRTPSPRRSRVSPAREYKPRPVTLYNECTSPQSESKPRPPTPPRTRQASVHSPAVESTARPRLSALPTRKQSPPPLSKPRPSLPTIERSQLPKDNSPLEPKPRPCSLALGALPTEYKDRRTSASQYRKQWFEHLPPASVVAEVKRQPALLRFKGKQLSILNMFFQRKTQNCNYNVMLPLLKIAKRNSKNRRLPVAHSSPIFA